MDRKFGRLIPKLRARGAFAKRLIAFASDTGPSAAIVAGGDGHAPAAPPGSAETHLCLGPGFSSACNTPLRRHKTWVHEGGISTPFIVHWPEGIAAHGALRHDATHLIDVAPTIVAAAAGQSQALAAAP